MKPTTSCCCPDCKKEIHRSITLLWIFSAYFQGRPTASAPRYSSRQRPEFFMARDTSVPTYRKCQGSGLCLEEYLGAEAVGLPG